MVCFSGVFIRNHPARAINHLRRRSPVDANCRMWHGLVWTETAVQILQANQVMSACRSDYGLRRLWRFSGRIAQREPAACGLYGRCNLPGGCGDAACMSPTLRPVSCKSGLRAERAPSSKRGCHVQQGKNDPQADRPNISQGLDLAPRCGHHPTETVPAILGFGSSGRDMYLRSGSARYRGLGSLAADEEHSRSVEQPCS